MLSSKTNRTTAGGRARTAPLAGTLRTRFAWAKAAPGAARAARIAMARRGFTSGDTAEASENHAQKGELEAQENLLGALAVAPLCGDSKQPPRTYDHSPAWTTSASLTDASARWSV